MRPLPNRFRVRGLRTSGVLAVAGLAVLVPSADAKTHRRHHPFAVALEPFELVHSAVHAVAAPVVHELPRAVVAVAALPVRAAIATARALPVEETEAASYAQPIRVAYVVPHAMPATAPRAEFYDEEFAEHDDAPRAPLETRGDRPMVAGSLAVLRNGIASAPAQAPQSVKNAIWAVNTLRHKPYTWGGGHGSFYDNGYDCSGTVSFAMHSAGALGSPIPSSEFMRFGERGRGRWITIYARHGHTFATIAGLRLDTTDFRNGGNEGPRWHTDMRDGRGFEARHPAGM